MSGSFPRARRRAFLAAALAILPIQAGTTVTLCNRSGRDLLVSREPGPDGAPIAITARSDEDPRVLRRLPPPPRCGAPSIEEAKSGGCPETGPGLPVPKPVDPGGAGTVPAARTLAPPAYHYLLEDGDVAMFCFEGKDLDLELCIHRLDDQEATVFSGLIITPAPPAKEPF